MAAAGLKLKPSKCELFKTNITYLGHIVSAKGIEMDPSKVEAIRTWPRPRTVTDVRSFFGFTNCYRMFVKGYAAVSKPLTAWTSDDNSKKKKAPVKWAEQCEEALVKLKELCLTPLVLAYVDYTKPLMLCTDASGIELGAVLSQKQSDATVRPIAVAGKLLTQSEQNYDAHKAEFLALKWSVTDRFHDYLYGGRFEVYTDNNPLTYVLTTA